MSRRFCLLILLTCILLFVTACGTSYIGQYGGLSDGGVFYTMTLNKDGTVETNVLGIPISGTYTVRNNQLTVKTTMMGYSQTFQAKITEDAIVFADTTLKKGVTSVDISEVTSLVSGKGQTQSTDAPTVKPTTKPTRPSKNEADEKLNEAERLFALGHYDEAIAIYDEIASEVDVKERRAYAIECRDIRDLYFEWHFNTRDSNIVSNGLVLDKYIGYGMDEVVVPYGTCGLTRTTFGEYNDNIVSIILPDTLTHIPNDCFSGCPVLRSINIPASIESFALNGSGITEITIPASVKTLPSYAFSECSKLKSVIFEGQPVISDGEKMFSKCTSLESITIPASFKRIPKGMFLECTALKSVILEEGIESIGYYAFDGCAALESFVFPESLTSIGDYVFRDCTSLTEITWPSMVTTIPEYTFDGCSALKVVNLPDSLDTIEEYAFKNCTSLYEIKLPKMLKSISSEAFEISRSVGDVVPITLVVTKGTYGHRYAEEQGLSYIFDGTVSDRVPQGYEFELGSYNGHPLSWVVLAHFGDHEMALCTTEVATKAYNDAGGTVTYRESSICSWLENEFYANAFEDYHDQTELDISVQLLPLSYYDRYFHHIDPSGSYFWLKDKSGYDDDEAVIATSSGMTVGHEKLNEEFFVRPVCILKLKNTSE